MAVFACLVKGIIGALGVNVDLEATVFRFGRCLGGKLLSH
jgi:hypothetical protein